MVTAEQLREVMPKCANLADQYEAYFNETMERFAITTPIRQCMFIAQAAHETNQLRKMVENPNFKVETILKYWGHRVDYQLATRLAGNPEAAANYLYANRYGNGPESSGDGYRYRGRGFFHLTFKANYANFSRFVYGDPQVLVNNPDLVAQPKLAALSGGHYWFSHNLNRLADADDFKAVTKAINGGYNGLSNREYFYERAKAALIGG